MSSTRFRPLASCHRILPVSLVLAGVILVVSFHCPPRPGWMLGVYVTATLCVTAWVNHITLAPVSSARTLLRLAANVGKDLLKLFFWWCVVMFPFAVILPSYSCVGDRIRVSEWLARTTDTRELISNRIKTNGHSIGSGTGLQLDFGEQKVSGIVMDSGQIALLSEEPSVVLFLTPAWVGGKVQWTCIGMPERVVPIHCRRDKGGARTFP